MGWNPDLIKPCDMCKRELTPPEQRLAVVNIPSPHGYLFVVTICVDCCEAECKALEKEAPDAERQPPESD